MGNSWIKIEGRGTHREAQASHTHGHAEIGEEREGYRAHGKVDLIPGEEVPGGVSSLDLD